MNRSFLFGSQTENEFSEKLIPGLAVLGQLGNSGGLMSLILRVWGLFRTMQASSLVDVVLGRNFSFQFECTQSKVSRNVGLLFFFS